MEIPNYWFKMFKSDNCIITTSYNYLLECDNSSNFNWVTAVKNELHSLGFGYVWFNTTFNNSQHNLLLIKQRILDQGNQFLRSSLEKSPKCFLYKHVIDLSESLQFYLTKYLPKKYRICIT